VRLELVVDGVAQVVELDLAAGTLKIGDRELPFRVVSAEGERAELEIAGEPVVVEGWPPHNDRPTGRLSVNGEVVRDPVAAPRWDRRTCPGSLRRRGRPGSSGGRVGRPRHAAPPAHARQGARAPGQGR
jgi:hypothetical protein